MKKIQSDQRFTHFTNCKIHSLYQKIPNQFGGYEINISYKIDDEDLFGTQYHSIYIDQQKFKDEILNFTNKNRLTYTDGMTDIDIFKQGDYYCIYWSPNDGIYHYYFFNKDEFNKLKQWFKLNTN